MRQMMKCGHIANATCNGKPYCVICDCDETVTGMPVLEGRMASCSHCGKVVPSSEDLPFFSYRPNCNTDSYYCGCYGWEQ